MVKGAFDIWADKSMVFELRDGVRSMRQSEKNFIKSWTSKYLFGNNGEKFQLHWAIGNFISETKFIESS